MIIDNFWPTFFIFGFAGFGVGMGLVIGSFVTRTLRRMMRETDEDERNHK